VGSLVGQKRQLLRWLLQSGASGSGKFSVRRTGAQNPSTSPVKEVAPPVRGEVYCRARAFKNKKKRIYFVIL